MCTIRLQNPIRITVSTLLGKRLQHNEFNERELYIVQFHHDPEQIHVWTFWLVERIDIAEDFPGRQRH